MYSSIDLVPQRLTGYMYRRTIYLSDLAEALLRSSHSESQDLYQIHIDYEQKSLVLAQTSISLLSKQNQEVEEKNTSPVIRNHHQVKCGCYLIGIKQRSG